MTAQAAVIDPAVFDVSRIPAGLREYWLTGAGAAKIRWGVGGDFNRCVSAINREIVKHGRAPLPDYEIKGLCANLHKMATGATPGNAPGEKAASVESVEFTAGRVRQPSKWWRKDGSRPRVGESTDGLLWHDPTTRHDDDGELKAIRSLRLAVEAGDYSNIDALVDAADAAEDEERKKARARAASEEARRVKLAEQGREIDRLVAGGMDYDEAESIVTRETITNVRKRRWLATQPGWDGTLGSFNQLVKADWLDEVGRLVDEAEGATNGQLLNKRWVGKVDPARIWMVDSDRQADELMTEELARWFDEDPARRPTLAEWRDHTLGQSTWTRRDGFHQ